MGTLLVLIICGAIYFLPTIIVLNNKNKASKMPVILTNIFFGWFLGIGWVIALIMATGKDTPTTVIVNNNNGSKE